MSECKEISNRPFVIFDSRTAKKTYAEYNHYRSADFFVPGGYVAIVELTAPMQYIQQMTFTAMRIPAKIPDTKSECYSNACIGKRYRRWRCCQSLGEDIVGTNFDDFSKSIVRWGLDTRNNEIVEFEFITRPGTYYLTAAKCNAADIEDCNNPTVFEVTLVPVDRIPELDLPCCPEPIVE